MALEITPSEAKAGLWYEGLVLNVKPVRFMDVNGNLIVPFNSLSYHFQPTFDFDVIGPRGSFGFRKYFLKDLIGWGNNDHADESTAEDGSKERPSKRQKLETPSDAEVISISDPKFKNAVKMLEDCLEQENLKSWFSVCQKIDLPEKDLIVAVGVHLVKKLSGSAYSREDAVKTKCPCGCDEKLEEADMCIGMADTWHGDLDLLSGGKRTNISFERGSEETDDDDSLDSFSMADLEAKENLSLSGLKLNKMFGESIVFSFTEFNRHSLDSPLVPSILISKAGFTFCIYDSTQDEMFLSEGYVSLPQNIEDASKPHGSYGIFILWIFLNHHIFFRHSPEMVVHIKSGFVKSLTQASLEKYKAMKEFSKNVETDKDADSVCLQFVSCLYDANIITSYKKLAELSSECPW